MDGNGRWARQRFMPRFFGHKQGVDALVRAVNAFADRGVRYLTVFAFSSENWNRPEKEVKALMTLLERYLKSELKSMMRNNIRLLAIGRTGALPPRVKAVLDDTVAKTAGNAAMTLILALNYGSHDEILQAVRTIAEEAGRRAIDSASITEESFAARLHTRGLPDPDLLIRTSGEYRLSNFLLWQMAYTEFYFTETLWPDFREEQLLEALLEYQKRERRFGQTSAQLQKTRS